MPNPYVRQLMRQAGLYDPAWTQTPQATLPQRRSPPRTETPTPGAWSRTPEAWLPTSPRQALNNPNTLPYYQPPTLAQQQQRQALSDLSYRGEAGRNEVNHPQGAYIGQDVMEMTGAPALARGIGHLRDGEPGEALPEVAMGGLGLIGLGMGAPELNTRAPRLPRVPRIPSQSLENELSGALRGANREDIDQLGGMFDDGGNMVSPEQYLGRPLTPDHIWNDPRFQHRLSITSDLEGIKTPEERFHIAGERIADQLPPPSGEAGPLTNDLDQWSAGGLPGSRLSMLDELIRRERNIGPGHDVESLITMARNMRNGEFPRALESELGEYGVGGAQQNTPLLGTPEIGADPMVAARRPGIGPSRQLPQRQGPNEDRYLFGRPQLPRSNAPDAGQPNAGQRIDAPDGSAPNAGQANGGSVRVYHGGAFPRGVSPEYDPIWWTENRDVADRFGEGFGTRQTLAGDLELGRNVRIQADDPRRITYHGVSPRDAALREDLRAAFGEDGVSADDLVDFMQGRGGKTYPYDTLTLEGVEEAGVRQTSHARLNENRRVRLVDLPARGSTSPPKTTPKRPPRSLPRRDR